MDFLLTLIFSQDFTKLPFLINISTHSTLLAGETAGLAPLQRCQPAVPAKRQSLVTRATTARRTALIRRQSNPITNAVAQDRPASQWNHKTPTLTMSLSGRENNKGRAGQKRCQAQRLPPQYHAPLQKQTEPIAATLADYPQVRKATMRLEQMIIAETPETTTLKRPKVNTVTISATYAMILTMVTETMKSSPCNGRG